MRDDEKFDPVHVGLARRVWAVAPSVRLTYHSDDDSLVAEFVQATAIAEVVVQSHLLVEFDSRDADAMPIALYLTGVRSAPNAPAVQTTRAILGEDLWAAAMALLAGDSEQIDIILDQQHSVALRTSWCGLAARLHGDGPAIIGVELIPGRVHAVMTDADATVLDTVERIIDRNDHAYVVSVIVELVDELKERHPRTHASDCPIAVQLGGPVDTRTGQVTFYDKPLQDDDAPWKDVPLGELIREKTGRCVTVYNDAQALANYESRFGLGRDKDTVAVLLVRRGVGAKLVLNGKVADFPMEIGIFVSGRSTSLRKTPARRRRSIESQAGTVAIIKRVSAVTGHPCHSVEDAADVAEYADEALDVFWQAGADLARGMAAIQAIVNPEAWAIYGPDAMVDSRTRSGRAFLGGLATMSWFLDWEGLRPGIFHPRSTTGSLGARAAAVAALGVSR